LDFFITLFILIHFSDENGYSPHWAWYFLILAIALCIALFMIRVSVNRTFIHRYMDVLSEFEQKWSSLAQRLNAEYAQRGVTVKTVRTTVLKRERRLGWTVGLGFQFRMQPVDDEEIAWCTSNSQTSGERDVVYQRRKLRVIKELPLRQAEGMSNGLDVVLGEQSGMAVAIAVVDEADVESASDVCRVNEKAALLNLV
jgi:hypothetical protein